MNSFDVFDTCLVRTLARPVDLLSLVAESVLRRNRAHVDKVEIVELTRLRVEAEQSARENSDREDVGLEEIYRHLDLEPWGLSPQEMREDELRFETEASRPIAQTRAEVEALRRAGEPIIFISDTPLPAGHVREMLEDALIARSEDRIYTSGDVGLTKASGRLFEYVSQREGVPVDRWSHRGDDPHSDLDMARRLGIRATPFFDSHPNRYEQILLHEGENEPWIRSRIAGVSRVARLMALTDDGQLSTLHEIAAGVIAPLLTCFVAWVMREARAAGIDRLYFVSRDGDILLQIARALEKRMPAPECRYLFGSRQAWLFPAISSMDPSELDWLLDESTSLCDLLTKLQLAPSEVSEALDAHGFGGADLGRQLEGEELERFWRVLQSQDVVSTVLDRTKRARASALAYLKQEGLTAPGSWAIVDVGWKLRSQWGLRRLLDSFGYGEAVRGFYLAVAPRRRPMSETGPYQALFLSEEHEDLLEIFTNAMVLEKAFLSADHGPVVGYQWDGAESVPVLNDWDDDPRRLRHLKELRSIVSVYADEAAEAGILERNLDELRRGALRVAHEFLTRPTREEARALAWITAVDDPVHSPAQERRLAVPLGARDVLGRLATGNLSRLDSVRRYRDRPKRYFWVEGSLALSKPWIRATYRLASRLRLKRVLLRVFRLFQGRHPAAPSEWRRR